nr:hypothetical protein [Tanacetum cinerariifolium]
MEIVSTTLEGVNERVTELDTTVREAMYAREAWAFFMDRSSAIAAYAKTLETHVAALIAQTSSPQTQLTTTLRYIEILEARDLEPQEGPAEAGSSWTFVYLLVIIVKFASCTLQGSTLTWWNSHIRAVGHDVAYAMRWAALKRMITEAAKVERYISGLLDIIHGSVKASKPQSMQEAIKFANEIIDKKMLTHAKCQAEQKMKFDDTSRNNQHQ